VKEGDDVFISLIELKLRCHIDFLNPQRNSAAIEEALLSCACGDWLVVIWPNSLARPLVIKEGLLVLELLAGSPVKQTRTTSMVLIHTACPPIL
jgi:hypothetical protein